MKLNNILTTLLILLQIGPLDWVVLFNQSLCPETPCANIRQTDYRPTISVSCHIPSATSPLPPGRNIMYPRLTLVWVQKEDCSFAVAKSLGHTSMGA